METYLSKITSKGQITLPKTIREKLKFRTGEYLELQIRGRELVIKTASSKSEDLILKEYASALSKKGPDNLPQLRKRFSGLPVSLSDEVREEREEN